jgi:hypothetical protein
LIITRIVSSISAPSRSSYCRFSTAMAKRKVTAEEMATTMFAPLIAPAEITPVLVKYVTFKAYEQPYWMD